MALNRSLSESISSFDAQRARVRYVRAPRTCRRSGCLRRSLPSGLVRACPRTSRTTQHARSARETRRRRSARRRAAAAAAYEIELSVFMRSVAGTGHVRLLSWELTQSMASSEARCGPRQPGTRGRSLPKLRAREQAGNDLLRLESSKVRVLG